LTVALLIRIQHLNLRYENLPMLFLRY